MSYLVNTRPVNPFGICLGESNGGGYTYTDVSISSNLQYGMRFDTNGGTGNISSANLEHRFRILILDLIEDYFKQTYNLPDDIEIDTSLNHDTWDTTAILRHENRQIQYDFETEAEALEFIDTPRKPEPYAQIPRYAGQTRNPLFNGSWQYEVDDGIFIAGSATLDYTGDPVTLYTINDAINFFASVFEVTPEEIPVSYSYLQPNTGNYPYPPAPSLDCEPYLTATIFNVDDPGAIAEVDIGPFTEYVSGDVIVTVIDGDPDVPLTEIVNGDGAVTIHDNGNVIMNNDGGTFFLNEFGNVGFYANNDASLTADTQVQLGVGATTLTGKNNCFTFRDSTGNVELTADDLTRLKALLD